MFGLVGILLALGLIMYLAYRGISVLLLAPVLATLAALFAFDAPLLGLYTQVFMSATGGFIITYFPLFLLGALFGKLMDDSGAAQAIALGIVKKLGNKHAILAIVISCAILTYGGVSLFVVAFAMYPIAARLFIQTNIPKRLLPATIALGAFTFTMTALPGSPAIQNTIPMPTFGTNAFAAPGLGVIAALVMLATGYAWIMHEAHKARKKGEGYGDPSADKSHQAHGTPRRRAGEAMVPETGHHKQEKQIQHRALASDTESAPRLHAEDFDPIEIGHHKQGRQTTGRTLVALIPILVVLVANYLFSNHVIPHWNTAYLKLPEFGGIEISSVLGIWATLLALLSGILTLIVLERTRFENLRATLDGGAHAAAIPIFNTASMVGFGAVIASLPAFIMLRDVVLGISTDNPLISLGIAVNVLAGITGSASGGLSIALHTLGVSYVRLADAAGISHELLHRVTTIATGGLDTLPHNGAVITLLGISKMTHREAYKDIFFAVVPGPILALIVVIGLGMAFGSF